MIAGDGSATAPQPELHAHWGCRNHYIGRFPTIQDCGVGDEIQMSVNFPQCWNGRDLDSTNHQSHVKHPRPEVRGFEAPR